MTIRVGIFPYVMYVFTVWLMEDVTFASMVAACLSKVN